jgi:hypothetical protein
MKLKIPSSNLLEEKIYLNALNILLLLPPLKKLPKTQKIK